VGLTRLYLATGDGFVRVADAESGDQGEETLVGSGAQCLAVDPRDPDVVYVGCRGSGVARTSDGGRSWEPAAELPERDVFAVAVSAADGTLYAGTEPSRLFRSRDGGESFEELTALQDIPSRPRWSFPPRPWTSHVRWIAPDPHDADRLLVGIELGGLMYSDDGGATFSDHRPGAQPDVHALAWHPTAEGRAYEAGGGGASWSHDAGRSWEPADAGRDDRYVWGLALDPDDPDRWYVSAAPGPGAAHGDGPAGARLYRWEGEGPWRQLTEPLDAMPYALAAMRDGTVFAGLSDGSVLRSVDRGESWDELRPLGTKSIVALAPAEG
jgi:photosystem II stability/assembly factor-like uncharacterized protein